jgi:hypothetical protein
MLLALAALARADDPVSWYALPTLDYTSDTGIGGGLAGGVYFERPDLEPYKAAIELDLYATTKRIQDHRLWGEILRFADLPLRIQGEVGFLATVSDSYCGIAGSPDCPQAMGPSDWLLRYTAPTGAVAALWQPTGWPAGLLAGLRGTRYRSGVFDVTTPYPGSLYAASFPDGEQGWHTTAMVGLLRDTRDDEIATRRGLRTEVSLRGGPVIGSQWRGGGVNATGIGFAPLTPRLTLATRLVLDAMWGEVPTMALDELGGWAGGRGLGGDIGRGIRAGRYIGRRKALGQQELRWMPLTISVAQTPVTLGGVGFLDGGRVADEGASVAAWGAGGGLRIDVGGDFLMRFDMGVSPAEDWRPFSYIDFGHAF